MILPANVRFLLKFFALFNLKRIRAPNVISPQEVSRTWQATKDSGDDVFQRREWPKSFGRNNSSGILICLKGAIKVWKCNLIVQMILKFRSLKSDFVL